jgi:hypothetical protein
MLEALIIMLLWVLKLTPLWLTIVGTVLMSLRLLGKIIVFIVRFISES